MVILNPIKGHGTLIQTLEAAMLSDRFSSTHIFAGPNGIGKKRVALGLAQNLLCEKNRENFKARACGECGSCKRVNNKQHESMLIIAPEKNQIKIEQSRSILHFCHLKSLHSSSVVIIDNVELMNPQAANAILKILEEPPKGVYFFMICGVLGALLPTLKSRAQIWHFRPLSFTDMKDLTSYPDWVISASQGSMETATLLIDDGDEDIKPHVLHWLNALTKANIEELLQDGRKLFANKENTLKVARLWQQLIRDAMVLPVQPEFVIHQDAMKTLEKLSTFSFDQLKELFSFAQELEASTFRHWDPQLTADHLTYESYKCLRGAL